MEIRPRYDGPPILDLGPASADPAGPMVRQRARLASLLADLREDEWAHPSRCEGWSVRDVVAHLITVNQFWAVSITSARRGQPTRFLVEFDPVATPAQLVEAQRHQPVAEVLARFEESCAELAAAVEGLAGDEWDQPGEAPPGHLALHGVVAHALWDSWVHERDILEPLGRPTVEEPEEVRESLRYAVALGLALRVLGGHEGDDVIVVDAWGPDVVLTARLGPTVVVRDGEPDGDTTVRVQGPAVELAEVFSVRRPLEDHVGDEHRWLLTGLATVFDQGG
jgi:uncharacterized protein (TIGR03083 family)